MRRADRVLFSAVSIAIAAGPGCGRSHQGPASSASAPSASPFGSAPPAPSPPEARSAAVPPAPSAEPIAASAASAPAARVKLPGVPPGIGFDDLRYSAKLHRVLVPAGRTGRLDLIDPDSLAITSVSGFSASKGYSGGHDDGVTSVDEAPGFLYATDRTDRKLVSVDSKQGAVVKETALAAPPDYVRYVASKREIWVTEPGASQIEIFHLGADGAPVHEAIVPVANGPESLVIDDSRGRAYTHRWQRSTVVIDLATRAAVAEWQNGCGASRGIALDGSRGFLFAACGEGTVSVLDVAHDGRTLSKLNEGSGFDVMGYNPSLGHLYLAGSSCACLVVLGVSPAGELRLLGRRDAPPSTHCAVADDANHAWVCDQRSGEILRFDDRYAATLTP